LNLNGFGEPLLNKNLFKMIRYVRKNLPYTFVSIFTNGMLLTEENCIKLLDSGLQRISISFDALSKEIYRSIRGGDFDMLVNNSKQLIRLKKNGGYDTQILFDFNQMDENYFQRDNVERFANNLGFDGVNIIRGVNSLWGYQPQKHSTKINVFEHCGEPWNYTQIAYNGDWVLCCWQPLKNQFCYGNVLDTSIKKLINSNQAKKIRKNFAQQNILIKNCKKCNYYVYGLK